MFWGDLPHDEPFSDAFDFPLKEAIISFQKRHFMEPTGVIDSPTAEALNNAMERAITYTKFSLRQIRQLEEYLEDKHFILVNLPTYELFGISGGAITHQQKVVIGRPQTPTPLMNCHLAKVSLNPSWNVPVSIFLRDTMRKIRKNPNFLQQRGFRVINHYGDIVSPYAVNWESFSQSYFPYNVQQLPGRNNAMGKIKFSLTSRNAIYLHGTPETSLFERTRRAYSSGCVRLSSPAELARWIVPGHIGRSIYKRLALKGQQTLTPQKKTPVVFSYIPIWFKDGGIMLSDDPYKKVVN
jgi:murein L,D-transpeptidase YcbB/YkuD